MKKGATKKIKLDPEIADVRRWREQLWKAAGESFEGLKKLCEQQRELRVQQEAQKPARRRTVRSKKK